MGGEAGYEELHEQAVPCTGYTNGAGVLGEGGIAVWFGYGS